MKVFSGAQPSGKIHIGNYLAAIKNWAELQDKNECLFSIVDLHAITVDYDAENFEKKINQLLAVYLAIGLDPEKVTIFLQSEIKEHSELAWLLSTITPLNELQRMTQFKDKSEKVAGKSGATINAGLLNYPILMAADILLYQTDIVPVGQDQVQHIEFARTIARKFNKKFGQTFKVPEAKVLKIGAKIMSLVDPTKKMSKSDENQESCIYITDSEKDIKRKISRSVTDSGKKIKYDAKKKAGISNLLTIYSLFSGKTIKETEKHFINKNYKQLKEELSDLLIEKLSPISKKIKELEGRDIYLKEVLEIGRKKAQKIAKSSMETVKRKMGLSIN
ncbi:MAG: tryptophan--tRNA ligase [bacterium]|nr:tryptophan--tRNA ligase [bacterium]